MFHDFRRTLKGRKDGKNVLIFSFLIVLDNIFLFPQMHIYIYDAFLNDKKYNNILARVETRITDLGLNGKISRLSVMKNVRAVIDNELRRGAKTIIAVGNDKTVSRVINEMAGSAVPLGIIPIGKENNIIASALGIPQEEKACDTLSARRIEKIDLGMAEQYRDEEPAGEKYFLTNASIANKGTIIEIKKDYSIEIGGEGYIDIINIPTPGKNLPEETDFNPKDGRIELVMREKPKKKIFSRQKKDQSLPSVFSLKNFYLLNNKNLPLLLDYSLEVHTPVEISAIKQGINVIVGKERSF